MRHQKVLTANGRPGASNSARVAVAGEGHGPSSPQAEPLRIESAARSEFEFRFCGALVAGQSQYATASSYARSTTGWFIRF